MRCERCNGNIVTIYGETACLQCGRVPNAQVRPPLSDAEMRRRMDNEAALDKKIKR